MAVYFEQKADTCTYFNVFLCLCLGVSAHVSVSLCHCFITECASVCVHLCAHVCMYVHLCVHMCVCVREREIL